MIADSDPLARRIVRDVCDIDDGVTVVAEATDGVEAVELALHYRPDVLLGELDLPRLAGLEVLSRIGQRAPQVRVVFLTVPCSADRELSALCAGARGVLSKDMPIEAVPEHLRRVMRGEATVSPRAQRQLALRLRALPQAGTGMRPVRSPLTQREWQVIDLLGAGATPAEVGTHLRLAPDTVRSHLTQIRRKLGVERTADIIRAAHRGCLRADTAA